MIKEKGARSVVLSGRGLWLRSLHTGDVSVTHAVPCGCQISDTGNQISRMASVHVDQLVVLLPLIGVRSWRPIGSAKTPSSQRHALYPALTNPVTSIDVCSGR